MYFLNFSGQLYEQVNRNEQRSSVIKITLEQTLRAEFGYCSDHVETDIGVSVTVSVYCGVNALMDQFLAVSVAVSWV